MQQNDFKVTEVVYAVIEREIIFLPEEAKYVMQDSRGSWYWSNRRPRIKEGDWTPNKSPIQLRLPSGKLAPSVIQTPVTTPWPDTMQRTIRQKPKKTG